MNTEGPVTKLVFDCSIKIPLGSQIPEWRVPVKRSEEAGEAGREVLVEGLQPAGSGEPGHPGKKGVRST